MLERFEGKSFLVTGAGSGIGRASAIRLSREGARVVLVGRNKANLEDTRELLPRRMHEVFVCDLTDEAQVVNMMKQTKNRTTSLSGMVHCAGVHWLRPLQITDSKSLTEMLSSHIVSSVALTRALVSERVFDSQRCSVVWFSSVAAFRGGAGAVAYAAAKGALISAARVLALELARKRIRVNVIAPGVVRTPQGEALLSKLPPDQATAIANDHVLGLGTPEDVAGVASFLMSEDAKWITGTTIVVDGGLTAH